MRPSALNTSSRVEPKDDDGLSPELLAGTPAVSSACDETLSVAEFFYMYAPVVLIQAASPSLNDSSEERARESQRAPSGLENLASPGATTVNNAHAAHFLRCSIHTDNSAWALLNT